MGSLEQQCAALAGRRLGAGRERCGCSFYRPHGLLWRGGGCACTARSLCCSIAHRASSNSAAQAQCTDGEKDADDGSGRSALAHADPADVEDGHLERQIKLTTSTFLALPAIVRNTNLAALMPQAIAREFLPPEEFTLLETDFPANQFTVSVHWSRRQEHSQMVRWARRVVLDLFKNG